MATTPAASGVFQIRAARREDVPAIFGFIKDLAAYERLSNEVVATEQLLDETLFGPRPAAEVVLGWEGNQAVGFALYFHNYSTFLARPGLYLEDLYITPEMRGRGYGHAMLTWLARLALERGCGRFEWSVLDWNERALRFYRSLGAAPLTGWTIYRVTGEALEKLAGKE
jgi:GNAT superfamily N-acetyltransferase